MSQWYRSHPLPALTDNWTHGAASRHTIAPISHTIATIGELLLISCPTKDVINCAEFFVDRRAETYTKFDTNPSIVYMELGCCREIVENVLRINAPNVGANVTLDTYILCTSC